MCLSDWGCRSEKRILVVSECTGKRTSNLCDFLSWEQPWIRYGWWVYEISDSIGNNCIRHLFQEKALDENARLRLYKMVNNGTLESIDGVVSTGKEAVVIHAKGGE